MLSTKFLKAELGLLKTDRERIINKAAKNRYMAVKTSTPLQSLQVASQLANPVADGRPLVEAAPANRHNAHEKR